jgi:hypothetical protein
MQKAERLEITSKVIRKSAGDGLKAGAAILRPIHRRAGSIAPSALGKF